MFVKKKTYEAPAIIEAAQFERRTLLTGCAKADPACKASVQTFASQCTTQQTILGQGSACANAAYVS